MSAKILNGKQLAADLKTDLKKSITSLLNQNQNFRLPCLAVVLVGKDPASQVYVNHKISSCDRVGIKSICVQLSEETTEEVLLQKLRDLAEDDEVDGILLQLPLPAHLNRDRFIHEIPPQKDVDGLTVYSQGALSFGRDGLAPCTPLGILKLLDHTKVDLTGKLAAVIGRSALVGASVTRLLEYRDCTTLSIASKTRHPQELTSQADIVIAAAGVRHLVNGSWIKPGAIVIDVGIHRHNDRLVGDVDFDAVVHKASWITPVPGGVGPMTIAMLLHNCVQAWRKNLNI